MNFQAHITKNHHLDMNKKETRPHIILSRGTYIQQKSANFKINMFLAFKKKEKHRGIERVQSNYLHSNLGYST